MEILESGKYKLTVDEAAEQAVEAVLRRDSCEVLIDPADLLDLEELMLLSSRGTIKRERCVP
jgi:hypothetical protein